MVKFTNPYPSVREILAYNAGINLKTVITSTGGFTYIQKAETGTATAAETWQIKRIEDSTGNVTWADGDSDFDNRAASATGLTYS